MIMALTADEVNEISKQRKTEKNNKNKHKLSVVIHMIQNPEDPSEDADLTGQVEKKK